MSDARDVSEHSPLLVGLFSDPTLTVGGMLEPLASLLLSRMRAMPMENSFRPPRTEAKSASLAQGRSRAVLRPIVILRHPPALNVDP
jgi:hypothetical protein